MGASTALILAPCPPRSSRWNQASAQQSCRDPVPSPGPPWCMWGRRGDRRAGILPRGPRPSTP